MLSKLPYLEALKLPDVWDVHMWHWQQDCGAPEVRRVANLARHLVFDRCPSLRLVTVNCNYSNAMGPVTLSILYQKKSTCGRKIGEKVRQICQRITGSDSATRR